MDWVVWTQRGDVLISEQVVRIFTIVILKILKLQPPGSNADGQTGL